MQENLVIVESPAKAKTIEKFLGKDYIVKSSFGHIRDLSKKDLGINIDDEFRPVYEIPGDKKKVVDELTKLAKSKTVWLASDEDREGEAIAWHLTEVLGLPVDQTKRIVFHEITKRAILEAIEKPRTGLLLVQEDNRIILLPVQELLRPLFLQGRFLQSNPTGQNLQPTAVLPASYYTNPAIQAFLWKGPPHPPSDHHIGLYFRLLLFAQKRSISRS